MKAKDNHSLLRDFIKLGRLWEFVKQDRSMLIGAAVLVPAIAMIEMLVPVAIKRAIDDGMTKGDWPSLAVSAMFYLGLVVLQYASRAAQTLLSSISVHRMINRLRHRLIDHVLKLSCSYHDRSQSGALVTRATADFENLSESLNTGVLTSIVDFAVLFGGFAGLFYLNWKLATASLVMLPAVLLVVSKFSRAIKAAMLRARVKIAELNAFTQEAFYGAATIKLLNAQSSAGARHATMTEDYRRVQMSSVILDATMFSIVDGLTSITIGIVLLAALSQLIPGTVLTAGTLVVFVQYMQQIFEPIKQLSNKIAMLQGAFTSLDRITAIIDTTSAIPGTQTLQHIEGSVEFSDVSFAYAKDSEPVLKNLSFVLSAGHSLALVGVTGGGKSSIVKLLTKLYGGYSGNIYLDGKDLSQLDGDWLRRNIGIVPQDIVVFEGTIAFNITLGRPGITHEDVVKAAEMVGAHSFIEKLPDTYQHKVREAGINLSHGMRQLIAFARAIANQPRVLVLDEATSSIDPESEQMVQRGIARLLKDRTVIVVAHRLSTVQKCDEIMVIGKGEVLERGTHQELVAIGGKYAGMVVPL